MAKLYYRCSGCGAVMEGYSETPGEIVEYRGAKCICDVCNHGKGESWTRFGFDFGREGEAKWS